MDKKIYKESIFHFKKNAFKSKKYYIACALIRDHSYFRYQCYKSYSLYHYHKNKKGIFSKLISFYRLFKYKKYSLKINVQINTNEYIENLYYSHNNIVINSNAKIGKNLLLLGCNCIGGVGDKYPIIGDNVIMSYGSIIVGGVSIGDNVKIGAGTTVVKDIPNGETCVGAASRTILHNN